METSFFVDEMIYNWNGLYVCSEVKKCESYNSCLHSTPHQLSAGCVCDLWCDRIRGYVKCKFVGVEETKK